MQHHFARCPWEPLNRQRMLLMMMMLHLALLLPNTSAAQKPMDAQAILSAVDRAANRAQDVSMTLGLQIQRGTDAAIHRTMRVWQRGQHQRMVKFVTPARLRGTGILVPKQGVTYLYLPAYNRMRRVSGREGGGSWMGTGFSIDDLARVRFADDYRATLQETTPETWTLRLNPITPSEHTHAFITIVVRRADYLVTRINTWSADGAMRRQIVASDFRTVDGYTIAHSIRVEEKANQRTTIATFSGIRFDRGISSSLFSERQLRRLP